MKENYYLIKNDPEMARLVDNADRVGEKFSIDLAKWYAALAFKVKLKDVADFLRVKETLTRLGIPSLGKGEEKPKLYQTCHILQKKGEYYIVHFKELLLLDGKEVNLTWNDLQRRAYIIDLLYTWGLVDMDQEDESRIYIDIDDETSGPKPVSLKILPYAEKENWELIAKYSIGSYRKKEENNG